MEWCCRDWCGDAIKMMNVTASDYNHVICYALYSSKAICDTCSGDGCAGTCPAASNIQTGQDSGTDFVMTVYALQQQLRSSKLSRMMTH